MNRDMMAMKAMAKTSSVKPPFPNIGQVLMDNDTSNISSLYASELRLLGFVLEEPDTMGIQQNSAENPDFFNIRTTTANEAQNAAVRRCPLNSEPGSVASIPASAASLEGSFSGAASAIFQVVSITLAPTVSACTPIIEEKDHESNPPATPIIQPVQFRPRLRRKRRMGPPPPYIPPTSSAPGSDLPLIAQISRLRTLALLQGHARYLR